MPVGMYYANLFHNKIKLDFPHQLVENNDCDHLVVVFMYC